MRAYIVTTFFGSVAVDENKKVLGVQAFEKDPEKAAEKFKTSEIKMIDEEKALLDKLSRQRLEVYFPFRKEGVKRFEQGNPGEIFVRENLRNIAIDNHIFKDQTELNQFMTKVNLEMTKVMIKKSYDKSNLVTQINGSIEDLDKSINIFSERLREWYSLHFPEMDRFVSSHEKYARIVEKFGNRNNIEDPEISLIKNKSMGADLPDEDIEPIKTMAKTLIELFEERKRLEAYLKNVLKEVAPNFTAIAGEALTAKMIAKAGGLDKLARMPSSTIQLIGAEKALFRYLKGRGGSPRHGIIFSHPLIQNSPDGHRGKIARMVAAKLSIAAKLDYYSKGKELRGDKMEKELEEKVKEILKTPAKPRTPHPDERGFHGKKPVGKGKGFSKHRR